MSISLKRLTQNGDTIVEVLMAVIVVSSVLTAGYGIALKSLQSIRTEQERTYALKLAEGQLENLKAAAIKDPAALATGSNYCVNNSGGTFTFSPIGGGSPDADMTKDTPSNYGSACTKDPNGGDCSSVCYMYGVIPSPGSHNYTASVRWDGPNGNRQQVQLAYRMYP